MKSLLTILFVGICTIIGYSQMADFVVRGNYSKTILKNELVAATVMKDLNAGYPASWISDSGYISTQIKSTIDGKEVTSAGNNETLTTAQRAVLSKLDIGSKVEVAVQYKSTNVVTKKVAPKTMKFEVTIIPNVEATYAGGYEALTQYFQDNNIKAIKEQLDQDEGLAVIRFVIDKTGKSTNVTVVSSSDNLEADQKLVELVKAMSNWTPAENADGEKVAQEFDLVVGSMIGC